MLEREGDERLFARKRGGRRGGDLRPKKPQTGPLGMSPPISIGKEKGIERGKRAI